MIEIFLKLLHLGQVFEDNLLLYISISRDWDAISHINSYKKYALKSSLAASCSVAPSSDSLGLRFEFFTWLSYIELSLLLSSLWSDWPWSLRVQQLWSNKHFSERDGDLWIETCTLLSGDDWQRGLRSEWGWIMALTRLSAAQARVLCLHYYSNALGFNFQDEDEVNWGWDCLSLSKVFVRRSTERIR